MTKLSKVRLEECQSEYDKPLVGGISPVTYSFIILILIQMCLNILFSQPAVRLLHVCALRAGTLCVRTCACLYVRVFACE